VKKRNFFILPLLLGIFLIIGCGKKADPRPLLTSAPTPSYNLANSSTTNREAAPPFVSYSGVSLSSVVTGNEIKICWAYIDSKIKITRVQLSRKASPVTKTEREEKLVMLSSSLTPASTNIGKTESNENDNSFVIINEFKREELEAMEKSGRRLCYIDANTPKGVLYTYKLVVYDDRGNRYVPTAMTQVLR